MTTVVSMNIKDASSTGLNRKRKRFQAFNANHLYREIYGYDDCPSEDDTVDDVYDSDAEYEYYDARGEPIRETRIRPEPIRIIPAFAGETPPPLVEVDFVKMGMMTNLLTGEECPEEFLDSTLTWKDSVGRWHASVKKKHDEMIAAAKAAEAKRQKEKVEKERLDAIVARLPRFSTAMLARMKAEAEKIKNAPAHASSHFYTHKGGPSKTSGQAWGHRRNGGGKGKKQVTMVAKVGQIKLSSIRDEKYKQKMLLADKEAKENKKMRRAERKIKDDEEESERQEAMERRIDFLAQLEEANKQTTVKEVEETEIQKRNREYMEEMRRIVASKVKVENEDVSRPKSIGDVESIIDADFKRARLDEERSRERARHERARPEERLEDTRPEWLVVSKKRTPERATPERVDRVDEGELLTKMLYAKPLELCKSIERGIPCRFGARCKFSHDKESAPKEAVSTTRTRLCLSVVKGGNCRHGKKCLFAHTPSEFSPLKCSFGGRCRNVKMVDGKCVNVDGKQICSFIHQEDKNAMCIRIGMKREVIERATREQARVVEQRRSPPTTSSAPPKAGTWAALV